MVVFLYSMFLFGCCGWLELDEILVVLVVDGYLLVEDVCQVCMGSCVGCSMVELYLLVVIVNVKLVNQCELGWLLGLEILIEWLVVQVDLLYLKIDLMKINVVVVIQMVSMVYVQCYWILLVVVSFGEIIFVICELFDSGWVCDLVQMFWCDVKCVVFSLLDINCYLQEFYGVQCLIQLVQDVKVVGYDSLVIFNFEQLVELGKIGEVGVDDCYVVYIVDWLLQYVFEQCVLDIYFELCCEVGYMCFCIDGVMYKVFELLLLVMIVVILCIKIFVWMDVLEKWWLQDGCIKMCLIFLCEVELCIFIMFIVFGEKVVMCIFDLDIVFKSFE